jgi:hypothetical protein
MQFMSLAFKMECLLFSYVQLCDVIVLTEQYSETCIHSSLCIFFTQVVFICCGPYKSDTVKTYLQLWFPALIIFLPQSLKKLWI